MPCFSIIIPCFHNSLDKLVLSKKCIDSVRKTSFDYELIIVENLQRWLVDEGNVNINSDRARTYAENINTGLAASIGGYICCLNNDLILPYGWVEAIDECFKIPDCGIATIDSTQYNRPPKEEIVEHFFGAFWVMKREVFEKVGYMDTGFRHAFDDADYWVRAYKEGYKIYMNRKIQAEHKGGSTIYEFEGHQDRFCNMRRRFNVKHRDCGLEIFNKLR